VGSTPTAGFRKDDCGEVIPGRLAHPIIAMIARMATPAIVNSFVLVIWAPNVISSNRGAKIARNSRIGAKLNVSLTQDPD
jgi:hypothetical protein